MYPHCSRCWGHSSDQSKDPVLMELMFNKGLDGGSVLWTREGDCVCGGRRWHAAFHVSKGLYEKVTLEQSPEASERTMSVSGGKASGRGNSQC